MPVRVRRLNGRFVENVRSSSIGRLRNGTVPLGHQSLAARLTQGTGNPAARAFNLRAQLPSSLPLLLIRVLVNHLSHPSIVCWFFTASLVKTARMVAHAWLTIPASNAILQFLGIRLPMLIHLAVAIQNPELTASFDVFIWRLTAALGVAHNEHFSFGQHQFRFFAL